MTDKIKQKGFTIVELLIVIVVIGILAALVITTFTGIQQQARDTERTTDIKAIHGQLEAYYAQKGSYPALAEINDSTWRSNNLRGLDDDALSDPRDDTTPVALVAGSAAVQDRYAYAAFAADGITACSTLAQDCAVYTLTADLEGDDPATYVKNNL